MKETFKWIGLVTLSLGLVACDNQSNGSEQTSASMSVKPILEDPYLWLEEIEGEEALAWVKERNKEGAAVLEQEPGFQDYQDRAEAILASKDRIAYPSFIGDHIYNFWQDDTHVRGIWRRTTLASYESEKPEWELVIDLDALAKDEGKNWVWKGANCRESDYQRCLISLSDGGKDAVELREFDLSSKTFVKDGFFVAEAKTWFDWYGDDALLLGTDFGDDSQTASGYPRIQKLWARGTDLSAAKTLLTIPSEEIGAGARASIGAERQDRTVFQMTTFWTGLTHHIKQDATLVQSPLPMDADFEILWNGYGIATMRSDWEIGGVVYPKGSLVAYEIDPLLKRGEAVVSQILKAENGLAIQQVKGAKDTLYVTVLDNVVGKLLALKPGASGWTSEAVNMPENGELSIVSTSSKSDLAFVNFEGFLTPDSLYLVGDGEPRKVKALPDRFDTENLEVTQHFARSKDGTQIPYFLVMKKDTPRDGSTPVWMWSYGGFEIPLTPSYVQPAQQFWLEEGGAYVVANIRGGGEFGPQWHQAALLKNRQKAYDDFIAVAEHLIETKVTTSERLGISGRSNGGLLMGAQLTQRPDLYNAVIIGVPLLDMLRYDKLLAGASWVGEYGDPDDADMRDYILTYSPYQNMDALADYPEVFIYTSTKDDRVHPGHARKFAARLKEMGHDFLYYENTEGGHAGVANLKQAAYRMTLELAYMNRRLR
ncbi:MAG: prolyl oligopeptidase family serine peptidase [Sphingomonadales bacterium]|jgi:prolyl oligopeptidase